MNTNSGTLSQKSIAGDLKLYGWDWDTCRLQLQDLYLIPQEASIISFCPTGPNAMLNMDARAVQWGTACRSAASVVLGSIERIQVGDVDLIELWWLISGGSCFGRHRSIPPSRHRLRVLHAAAASTAADLHFDLATAALRAAGLDRYRAGVKTRVWLRRRKRFRRRCQRTTLRRLRPEA